MDEIRRILFERRTRPGESRISDLMRMAETEGGAVTANVGKLRQLMNFEKPKLGGPQSWQEYADLVNANLKQNFPTDPRDPGFREAVKNMAMNFAPLGITVFHGSPHRFDRFDMSKIGTGEGAQAYGHGLYFAENPSVAKQYAADLGKKVPAFDGVPTRTTAETFAHDILSKYDPSIAKKVVDSYVDGGVFKGGDAEAMRKSIYEAIDRYGQSKAGLANTGLTYKVDLPDDQVAKMLDWDKPLSQQPENVKEFFRLQGFDVGSAMTSEQLHSAAKKYLSGKQVSKMANEDIYFARDLAAARKAWNGGPAALEDYMSTGDGSWLRGVLTRSKDGNKLGGVAYKELADKLGGFGQASYQGGGQVAASDALRTGGASLLGMSGGPRGFPSGGTGMNATPNFGLMQVPGIRYLDGGSRAGGKGTSNFVVFSDDITKIIGRE